MINRDPELWRALGGLEAESRRHTEIVLSLQDQLRRHTDLLLAQHHVLRTILALVAARAPFQPSPAPPSGSAAAPAPSPPSTPASPSPPASSLGTLREWIVAATAVAALAAAISGQMPWSELAKLLSGLGKP